MELAAEKHLTHGFLLISRFYMGCSCKMLTFSAKMSIEETCLKQLELKCKKHINLQFICKLPYKQQRAISNKVDAAKSGLKFMMLLLKHSHSVLFFIFCRW